VYKSFKFALFNKSFPNPAKFQIRPNFGRSWISAGFVKKAGFRPEPETEPNSGTALMQTVFYYYMSHQCQYCVCKEFCESSGRPSRVVEMSRCQLLDYSKKVRVVNNSTSRLNQRRVVPKFYANAAFLRSAIAEKPCDTRLLNFYVGRVEMSSC